jgi:transcriptional regulator with XRE-family HTH domain
MVGHDGDAYTAERARLLRAFGTRLRAERDRLNVSQETLAEIATVHRTHLAALERGRREPHLSMLLVLADALEVPPGTLFEGLFVPRERKAPTHSKNGRPTPGRKNLAKPAEGLEGKAANGQAAAGREA